VKALGKRTGLVLMRVLLGVAMVVVTAGAVSAVVGPKGLDIGGPTVLGVLPPPPYVPLLWWDTAPEIPVVPDSGFQARVAEVGAEDSGGIFGATLFPWKDTSDGTRDARTGLPPVELGSEMALYVLQPPWRGRLAYAGPVLFTQALALTVLVLLWRIVGTVASGEVFVRENARRMLAIGVIVAVGGSLAQVLRYLGWVDMIEHSAAAGVVRAAWSFSFLPLLAGAVILLLAEVFRQGVRIRADVEGLV